MGIDGGLESNDGLVGSQGVGNFRGDFEETGELRVCAFEASLNGVETGLTSTLESRAQ